MTISLNEAVELVTLEADLLDHDGFREWLDLYVPDGLYIVPIDPNAATFEGVLNYAYDDAHMREKRVERLLGGRSISAAPPARTVRMLGRYRMLEASDETCVLRCAMTLTELRQHRLREYAANITYTLIKTNTGLKIQNKIIKLLNSTENLTAISYIL
ncbi:aromatic-ring-hydroxylating dioxygenase subunit beta [Acetobacter nitrogenifigens DSM 23921 = NBRC 105050]|uniref:Aromatic-ring-hydroxylating dioxygenase subunit beta n=1 Tax=Acetobacter nitrogenifigens DSM 23921 = NBRC 105050 TaxID=1120919 RepID=A0A511XFS2_9PROT|nr:aromatic-ring-hydroxylating dioxygenase subunit beta [Acetobacter nitrogenifigens]GBQ99729.1 aromatic-ring-hydroxylating dioxygenase subunit beta [Acetobacter nitrogenifigens DSM 23921 = NBRC 105050]GEN61741.1 aromatic-ring-hydroxylating dioxygenase subunit beta [Acetobacter nitrogenifigens DSM 23921 = NBRC 105050]